MPGRTKLMMRWALLGLLSVAAAGPAMARPGGPDGYMPIGVAPRHLTSPPPVPVMVLPQGWQPGDVAAVLPPASDWPPGARDRLASALMQAGAAVLYLPDPGRPGGLPPTEAMGEALRALHGVIGVGLAVAIGNGPADEAALRAAAEAATEEGRRYAAAVRLGPSPEFRFADAPQAEGWPARAWVFCDLLAQLEVTERAAFARACQERVAAMR